ncbi:MAG TPA: hypothetical protein VGM05_04220 [Planctomycetaceae bacterium]|jgi:hypothetical protein
MQNNSRFAVSGLIDNFCAPALIAGALATLCLSGAGPVLAADNDRIVIRPANYDPADELAYTRLKGEVEAGKSADGKFWNQPVSDLRAAEAGASPSDNASREGEAPASAASGPLEPRMSYAAAYSQIPFSRSEYEANPGYRHDAALELMMGAMRPTTVMRMTMPYFSRYPDLFRYKYPVYPYLNMGGGSTNMNMNWNTSLIAY